MNWQKAKLYIPLGILVLGVVCFTLLPQILSHTILGELRIPLGTFIAWMMLIAYSGFAVLLFPKRSKTKLHKILYVGLLVNFCLAVCWGVISYLLSGNWNFIFQEGKGFKLWIGFTAGLVVIPLLVYCCIGITTLWSRFTSR